MGGPIRQSPRVSDLGDRRIDSDSHDNEYGADSIVAGIAEFNFVFRLDLREDDSGNGHGQSSGRFENSRYLHEPDRFYADASLWNCLGCSGDGNFQNPHGSNPALRDRRLRGGHMRFVNMLDSRVHSFSRHARNPSAPPGDFGVATATSTLFMGVINMGQLIGYRRPDSETVNGYLAEPKNAKNAPGIVVIQEWWGLTDQIKGVADRFANAGYRALVPDLYRGKIAIEANEAEHLMSDLNFGDAAGQDIRGAVQYLKSSGSNTVGVTGFCMGGALTLLSAVHVPELDASVIWYGYPPLEYVDADKIDKPIIGHWGLLDTAFPIAGVDRLEGALNAAGKSFEFFRYDAKHAFANEESNSRNLPFLQYSPVAANLAWERTMEFFKNTL